MTETAGQIDIFEVLAAAEADEQNSRIDRNGVPVLLWVVCRARVIGIGYGFHWN